MFIEGGPGARLFHAGKDARFFAVGPPPGTPPAFFVPAFALSSPSPGTPFFSGPRSLERLRRSFFCLRKARENLLPAAFLRGRSCSGPRPRERLRCSFFICGKREENGSL